MSKPSQVITLCYEHAPVVKVSLYEYRALIESETRLEIAKALLESETSSYIDPKDLRIVIGCKPACESDKA